MAETGSGKGPEDSRRIEAALAQRYTGIALLALAVLIYWSVRLVVAWWSG